MKQNLNEIKRIQHLAGIIAESLHEGLIDNKILKTAKKAIDNGSEVTIMIPVKVNDIKVLAGAFSTDDGLIRISSLENPSEDIKVDGESIGNLITAAEPQSTPTYTQSPEDIEAEKQAIAKRYGPGGGQDTPLGRRTFD